MKDVNSFNCLLLIFYLAKKKKKGGGLIIIANTFINISNIDYSGGIVGWFNLCPKIKKKKN